MDFVIRRGQQKARSPAIQRMPLSCAKSFSLPKQAKVSDVKVSYVKHQAQYQAFVRFAVGSGAALEAIALNWTCVLEPFNRGGLSR